MYLLELSLLALVGCSLSAVAPNKTKSAVKSKSSVDVDRRAFTASCDYAQSIEYSSCNIHTCIYPAYLNSYGECECPCEYILSPDGYTCELIPPPPPPPPPSCHDYVDGVSWQITYDEYCGEYGHCSVSDNGTIICVCDGCHYGSQCQNLHASCEPPPPICHRDCTQCPTPICPPQEPCPTERPFTCNDYVPFLSPQTRYKEACDPGVCDQTNGVRCICPACRTGAFCEQIVDSIECQQETCPTCPPPETCPPCPPQLPCPTQTCPTPEPITCDSIVANGQGGRSVTYREACEVDTSNPHGQCVDEGNGHVYCVCTPCWDGLFCGHYNIDQCPPAECTTPKTPVGPQRCSDHIPGIFPLISYNEACSVNITDSHGVCLDNIDGTRQCQCNPCWTGTFCNTNLCPTTYTPCPTPPHTVPPPPITCNSNIPGLFPPQSYEQACRVDNASPHGHCIETPGIGEGLECVCNPCWSGTFCEHNTCPQTCPPPPPPPQYGCLDKIPDWATGKTYNDECGAHEGRGICVGEPGGLSCQCNECWTGDFCQHNACIRRCSYNKRRPAFYHIPPSPLLYPQPVGGSDLPDELLACPKNFECVPDDKNCQYDVQDCINNIGWCIPAKREIESPAHPSDDDRREGGRVGLKDAVPKTSKKSSKTADKKSS